MTGPQPFRLEPKMGPAAYKSYQLLAPLGTHWRPATCEEVDCQNWRSGWRVRIEGLAPAMLHAAQHSGRKYLQFDIAPGETYLVFEAGQRCFAASQHRIRVERDPLYVVRDGDHRGNPRGTAARQHQRPEDWVTDFAEHQARINEEIERG